MDGWVHNSLRQTTLMRARGLSQGASALFLRVSLCGCQVKKFVSPVCSCKILHSFLCVARHGGVSSASDPIIVHRRDTPL